MESLSSLTRFPSLDMFEAGFDVDSLLEDLVPSPSLLLDGPFDDGLPDAADYMDVPAATTSSAPAASAAHAPEPAPAAAGESTWDGDDDAGEAGAAGTPEPDSDAQGTSTKASGKRRRRVRNGRQQELNRLAQQRYRERKKQKAATLAASVEDLTKRLDTLDSLRHANQLLQSRIAELERTNAAQCEQLAAAQATVAAQARRLETLSSSDSGCAADVNNVGNDAAAVGAGGSGGNVVGEQLAGALRAVLSTMPDRDVADVLGRLPEGVLAHIHSCCREVAAGALRAPGGDATKAPPRAIPVSCC